MVGEPRQAISEWGALGARPLGRGHPGLPRGELPTVRVSPTPASAERGARNGRKMLPPLSPPPHQTQGPQLWVSLHPALQPEGQTRASRGFGSPPADLKPQPRVSPLGWVLGS